MSTQLSTAHGGGLMTADQAAAVRSALKSSLYPGASDASVDMVLAYCKAAGLDPMTKAIHIVPISVKSGRKDGDNKDIYENRDVVMPGIGLYRVRAASTGAFVGVSAPDFGPMKQLAIRRKETTWENRQKRETWVDDVLEYPEWCRVTVYRMVGNQRCEFSAVEYWMENYATAGRNTATPNEMWMRRPRGQLAKCSEAQALRKAFPEFGSGPTAEEMEGAADHDAGYAAAPAAPADNMPQRLSAKSTEPAPASDVIDMDPETGEVLPTKPEGAAAEIMANMPNGMRKGVEKQLDSAGLAVDQLAADKPDFGIGDTAKCAADFNSLKAWIASKAAA